MRDKRVWEVKLIIEDKPEKDEEFLSEKDIKEMVETANYMAGIKARIDYIAVKSF